MTRRTLALIVFGLLGFLGVASVAFGVLASAPPTLGDLAAATRYTGSSVSSLSLAAPSGLSATGQVGGSIKLAWTASPSTSARPDLTFSYNLYRRPTGTTSFALLTPTPLTALSYTDTPAADGSYDYIVRTVISSFTSAASTATSTALSDRTAPSVSMTCSGAACASGWYTTAVGVTLTATDAGSGVKSVSYSVDGGTPVTVLGSSASFTVSGDSTGHTVLFYATDNLGNTGTQTTQVIRIDATPPVISSWAVCDEDGVVQPQTADWIHKLSSYEVFANLSDAGSGLASVSASIGATGSPASATFNLTARVGSCAGSSYSYSSGVQTAPNIGGNTTSLAWLNITATDAAGNSVQSNPSLAGDVNVDNKTPNMPGFADTLGSTGSGQVVLTWATSQFSASGGAGYLVKAYISGTNTLVTSVTVLAPATTTTLTLSSGTKYDFTIQSADNAGNNSTVSSLTGVTAP